MEIIEELVMQLEGEIPSLWEGHFDFYLKITASKQDSVISRGS